MLFPKFVSERCYHLIRSEYPAVMSDPDFLRFVMYLAFGNWLDVTTKQLRLDQKVCAILEDKLDLLSSRHYDAGVFLSKMSLLLPGFKFSGWTWKNDPRQKNEAHSRRVIETGFSTSFCQMIEQEIQNILRSPVENLIHYEQGTKYFKKKHFSETKKEVESIREAITKQCSSISDAQIRFMDYFNSLPSNMFSMSLKKNMDSTIKLANNMVWKNEQVKQNNLKILTQLSFQPKPYYIPIEGTSRLYTLGSSLTTLKRELRKELTKGWIEFDIVNCHLAIAAKNWNVPLVLEVLSSGKSIWQYLDDISQGQLKAMSDGKKILKQFIYSMMLGRSKSELKKLLQSHGMTNKQVKQFFSLDIIDQIYKAREQELKSIMLCLIGNKDCYGQELSYTKPNSAHDRRPARSIMSRQFQAYEMKMLEPLIEFSENNRDIFLASLYQFDGFSVVCHDKCRIKTQCEKLKKCLDEHITSLGFQTHIKYEVNT